MEIKKIKCPKCNHEWITRSELILVTCPSCGVKTKNIYTTRRRQSARWKQKK